MDQLLSTSSLFPTVIYSVLLGIVVVYWLIGLLGIVDLDLSADSGLDADMDIDSDINIDTDGEANLGAMAGLFLTFGLTGVPLTLTLSIIVLLCWLISVYSQFYLLTLLPEGVLYYLVGLACAPAIFFISLPITGIVIRPLKKLFKSSETTKSHSLIGKEATVVTGKVSEAFGQARVFNDGAELLLDVRCDPQHVLSQGDSVLLIEYTQKNHTFIVAPMPH